jgi:hypothetical protein
MALHAGYVAAVAQLGEVQLRAETQGPQHRVGREGTRIIGLHLSQVEQVEGVHVEGARPGEGLGGVAGELRVRALQKVAHQGEYGEARVGVLAPARVLVGVRAPARRPAGVQIIEQPLYRTPVVRLHVLLKLQTAVDLPLGGGQVVGEDGLEPVEGGEVLAGLLELEGQLHRDEVEYLLHVVRGIVGVRYVLFSEEVPDHLAPGGQFRLGELVRDPEVFLGVQPR